VLLCHQLRALDQSRLRDKLGEVSEEVMIAIEACLLFTLGISLGE
jgi:mRNA-degrading endonuclease toxin of MazEF toxin-antitoxin module